MRSFTVVRSCVSAVIVAATGVICVQVNAFAFAFKSSLITSQYYYKHIFSRMMCCLTFNCIILRSTKSNLLHLVYNTENVRCFRF